MFVSRLIMISISKDPRFISHDVPKGAPKHIETLYEEYQTVQCLAKQENWKGVRPENVVFEYNTNNNTAEILFKFIDKNQHTHNIIVSFDGDSVSATCWFSYLFKADNFDENALTVQSFAECLMVQLWDCGIDADLCECDWGLEFPSSIGEVALNMNTLVNAIVSSIKPMEWFYSDGTIWKFSSIHSHLLKILPQLRQEAETGRWKFVKSENFTLLRDKTQAYIVLTYQESGIFDMTFKVGFNENGFDPDVSGKWFTCEYDFNIRTQEDDIKDYYMSEQKEFCKIASVILDWTSYNSLFAYDDDLTALTLLVSQKWAFHKYCLMLDIMIPLLSKYKASKLLVTKKVLEQKAKLESLLHTEMVIVEDSDSNHIFDKGEFIPKLKDSNTIFTVDMPF